MVLRAGSASNDNEGRLELIVIDDEHSNMIVGKKEV